MLTLKIYTDGAVAIQQYVELLAISPVSSIWDETVAALRATQPQVPREEPHRIIIGTNMADEELTVPLYGQAEAFVTNEDGQTVEVIRPPKGSSNTH